MDPQLPHGQPRPLGRGVALDEFERVHLEVEGEELPFVIVGIFGVDDRDYAMVCPEDPFHTSDLDQMPLHVFGFSRDGNAEPLVHPIRDEAEAEDVQHVYEDLMAIWADEH